MPSTISILGSVIVISLLATIIPSSFIATEATLAVVTVGSSLSMKVLKYFIFNVLIAL